MSIANVTYGMVE